MKEITIIRIVMGIIGMCVLSSLLNILLIIFIILMADFGKNLTDVGLFKAMVFGFYPVVLIVSFLAGYTYPIEEAP